MLPICNCQSKLINQPSSFSIIQGSDSYNYVRSLILKLNAIENEYCQQRKHSTDKISHLLLLPEHNHEAITSPPACKQYEVMKSKVYISILMILGLQMCLGVLRLGIFMGMLL